MYFFSILLFLAPLLSASDAEVSKEIVSLGDIVKSFDKSKLGLRGKPFPPILVRVMFHELVLTFDPIKGTILFPSDGELKVEITKTSYGDMDVKMVEGDTRVPVQETSQQLRILANGYQESYFYKPLLEACDRNEPLVSPSPLKSIHEKLDGGIPHDVYVQMIWKQVIRVYKMLKLGHEWALEKTEILLMADICTDETYDLLVQLMDPPLRVEGKESLGKGAFGIVRRGILKNIGSVAVKTIVLDAKSFGFLINEILASRAMSSNPHFVKIYGVEMKDYHTMDITMELLEGMDGKYIAERGLIQDVRILAAIIKEVLKGIQSLHEKNFLHNDIKPDNIFITKEGKVKVLDLGLATPIQRSFEPGQWKAGVVGIAGPELYDPNVDYTTASDIWTVGILMPYLYENTAILDLPLPLRDNPEQPPIDQAKLREAYRSEINRILELFHEPDAKNFLESILQHESSKRPKIHELLEHPFIKSAASETDLKDLFEAIKRKLQLPM